MPEQYLSGAPKVVLAVFDYLDRDKHVHTPMALNGGLRLMLRTW